MFFGIILVLAFAGLVIGFVVVGRRAARISRRGFDTLELQTELEAIAAQAGEKVEKAGAAGATSPVVEPLSDQLDTRFDDAIGDVDIDYDDSIEAEAAEAATAGTERALATADIEARLARLGDLHARQLISDDELAAARAKILAG